MATLEPVLSERGIAPLPLEVFVREDVTRSVNLRDIGHLSHRIKQKVIFRSSQVVSPVQIRALDIKSVIDLRRAPATCTFQHRNILQKIYRFGSLVAAWFGPRRLPPRSGNANKHEQSLNKDNDINQPTKRERLLQAGDVLPGEAAPCWRCTEACLGKYGCQALVYHVDLLPGLVPVYIFAKLPWKLKLKVTWMAIRGGKKGRAHVEPVVAGAVADPNVLGYLELYKIMLTRSREAVASVLRLLAQEDYALPALIHCRHGKDRTGLVVMLLYLLCGVEKQIILDDYAKSESLLRESRENRELLGMADEMTTDEVIASAAHVMESTIEFLNHRYGGVETYLHKAGLEEGEIQQLRYKLICNDDDDDVV